VPNSGNFVNHPQLYAVPVTARTQCIALTEKTNCEKEPAQPGTRSTLRLDFRFHGNDTSTFSKTNRSQPPCFVVPAQAGTQCMASTEKQTAKKNLHNQEHVQHSDWISAFTEMTRQLSLKLIDPDCHVLSSPPMRCTSAWPQQKNIR